MFKHKSFFLFSLTLMLAACHFGWPTKSDVAALYNSNLHLESGKSVKITDLRCDKHETGKFICFVGYKIVDNKGNPVKGAPTQGREDVQLFQLDGQWVARGL